uniref:Uncharacterized protein n=1 Tax=Aegilops tauschii subsp. strangulata TaxID=200361 RepID=A0A453JH17_AEGTS
KWQAPLYIAASAVVPLRRQPNTQPWRFLLASAPSKATGFGQSAPPAPKRPLFWGLPKGLAHAWCQLQLRSGPSSARPLCLRLLGSAPQQRQPGQARYCTIAIHIFTPQINKPG